MKFARCGRAGLGLAMIIGLTVGCAGRARVQNVQAQPAANRPRPARVVVFDFDTGAADVRVGRSPRRTATRAVGLYVDQTDALAYVVADTVATTLVDDLKARGFNAVRAAKAAPPAATDLVIQGQFVEIDQGSQTQRFVIGLGVGATEVRTQVQVFQAGRQGWEPVKQFDTVASGSRMPGAAFFVAGGAAGGTVAASAMITSGVGVVREIIASIDRDARRTAEQIAGKVSEVSAAQGW